MLYAPFTENMQKMVCTQFGDDVNSEQKKNHQLNSNCISDGKNRSSSSRSQKLFIHEVLVIILSLLKFSKFVFSSSYNEHHYSETSKSWALGDARMSKWVLVIHTIYPCKWYVYDNSVLNETEKMWSICKWIIRRVWFRRERYAFLFLFAGQSICSESSHTKA